MPGWHNPEVASSLARSPTGKLMEMLESLCVIYCLRHSGNLLAGMFAIRRRTINCLRSAGIMSVITVAVATAAAAAATAYGHLLVLLPASKPPFSQVDAQGSPGAPSACHPLVVYIC
eukprot:1147208-Pelagomonas_calceolata.AAC.1